MRNIPYCPTKLKPCVQSDAYNMSCSFDWRVTLFLPHILAPHYTTTMEQHLKFTGKSFVINFRGCCYSE